ncbi:LysR family transcriptional regulator [Ligilactobacillus sp.]|uniref:LysR family transcriptional regulator n=1 Tax=Ligilactobacillus sp. TaxID=2767921 RepID=UPI002FE3DFDB
MLMLLRQMRCFASVVECGSFTEAAERCFISQSAVSQQIKSLEQELGVSLLLRKNRGFSLTPAGRYFYEGCVRILKEADELKENTTRMGTGSKASLRIGYLNLYNGQELYQAISEFSGSFPEVSIEISPGTHEQLYNGLRSGRIDMALNDQRRAFSSEYVNFVLKNCGCLVEISSQNPLGEEKSVTMRDLRNLPCILVAPESQRKVEERYYSETLGYESSFLFADSLDAARLLAIGGRGFIPLEEAGELPPPSPGLKRIPLVNGSGRLARNYCFFWRRERTNRYIERFANILHDLVRGN